MDIMYLDESGKGLFTNPVHKGLYLFGGMIVNKAVVYDCLNKFKPIYQEHRKELRKILRKEIAGEDREQVLKTLMNNFEIHSVKIFNTKEPYTNPWYYYPVEKKFRLLNDLIDVAIDSVEVVYFFRAQKVSIGKYIDEQNYIMPSHFKEKVFYDRKTDEYMIKFIVSTFHDWLDEKGRKGTIVPDELEPHIREGFVEAMKNIGSSLCWDEPIVVNSAMNAFTQLVDIFTYIYFKLENTPEGETENTSGVDGSFNLIKAIRRIYKKKIKDKVIVLDLEEYLRKSEKVLDEIC